ncbi:MAG: pirin family protein [Myxococcales bacterium]|nr:pirin family protein [Myxococcales bacterium]
MERDVIRIRKGAERGRTRLDWLDSWHGFSFGDYYDPRHVAFRSLRVLNEDRIAPGAGFAPHPHRDMEIVTYVLAGALRHEDSAGHGAVIRPGEVQRMSAGTGIVHSEVNASRAESVHLLQIWLLPERNGLPPGYEQRAFDPEELRDRLRLVGSRDARDGSVRIHQDVALYAGRLSAGTRVRHALEPGRAAWVQLARGRATVCGVSLEAGDGAAIEAEHAVDVVADEPAELLLFDLR